ncbi:hypothetical protein GQ457_11G000640 [Hibiscus cannabinus]
MVLSQRIHKAFKGTVERITWPQTVSVFKEKGVLRVLEFILVGDNLVSKCHTWSWYLFHALNICGIRTSKRKSYSPPKKQYLITRNNKLTTICLDFLLFPLPKEGSSVEEEHEAARGEVILDNEDNTAGWRLMGNPKMNMIYLTLADYEEVDNLVETDAETLQPKYLVAQEPVDDNILRTQTYDVSMINKYHQTPRVWLTGIMRLSRMLLQSNRVMEDVSHDVQT